MDIGSCWAKDSWVDGSWADRSWADVITYPKIIMTIDGRVFQHVAGILYIEL